MEQLFQLTVRVHLYLVGACSVRYVYAYYEHVERPLAKTGERDPAADGSGVSDLPSCPW